MMIGHQYVRDTDPKDVGEEHPAVRAQYFHSVEAEWPLYSIAIISGRDGGITVSLNHKDEMEAWWTPCSQLYPLPIELVPEFLKMLAEALTGAPMANGGEFKYPS